MSTISARLRRADYFMKYPGRFFSMHLQDIDMNATPPPPAGRPAGAARTPAAAAASQTAVGKGTIDWAKTFAAAKTGGVKNYFVEQNDGADEGERRVPQDVYRLKPAAGSGPAARGSTVIATSGKLGDGSTHRFQVEDLA